MKSVDYIVVGGGFAGLFFAHQLILHNKSFILISDRKNAASEVAGGIINPIVLNRFTSFWLGNEQLIFLKKSLLEIKEYLGKDYFQNKPVCRILHDEKEKQTWIDKSASDELSSYLKSNFFFDETMNNPFGIGEVLQSGRLEVQAFFNDFFEFLTGKQCFINSTFDFNLLQPAISKYKDIQYKNIVFADGIRVLENPYFSQIPIIPSKGHYLVVKLSKPLPKNIIYKKKYFLFHIENDLYFVGGTYEKNNFDESVDEHSIQQLKQSIEEIYPFPFTIESIGTGIRPTLEDRKPTLGVNSTYKNMFVLNGMGTRGVLNGCYFSKILYDYIENNTALDPSIDINRFII